MSQRDPEFRYPRTDGELFSLSVLHDAAIRTIRLDDVSFDLSIDLEMDWDSKANSSENRPIYTITFTDAHAMEVVRHYSKTGRTQAKYDPQASEAEQRSRITTSVYARSVDWEEFARKRSDGSYSYIYTGELVRNDLGASVWISVSDSDHIDYTVTISGSSVVCSREGQALTLEELLGRGKEYWDNFYGRTETDTPSQFAEQGEIERLDYLRSLTSPAVQWRCRGGVLLQVSSMRPHRRYAPPPPQVGEEILIV